MVRKSKKAAAEKSNGTVTPIRVTDISETPTVKELRHKHGGRKVENLTKFSDRVKAMEVQITRIRNGEEPLRTIYPFTEKGSGKFATFTPEQKAAKYDRDRIWRETKAGKEYKAKQAARAKEAATAKEAAATSTKKAAKKAARKAAKKGGKKKTAKKKKAAKKAASK